MNREIPPIVKYEKLLCFLRPMLAEGLIVAYSGGVDSAFLLYTAEQSRKMFGGKLLALTTESASFSDVEKQDAIEFARLIEVEHRFEKSLELENPKYLKNDNLRCYHCKTELFRISHATAAKLGYEHIAYGYNFSDQGDFRPGHQAAIENEILSPLFDAEMTKSEIRALMVEFNLPLFDKPASPCLSSRLMTGVIVTKEKLGDIEFLESLLRNGGLRIFRVRLHEANDIKFVRVEVDLTEFDRLLEIREDFVNEALKRGFQWVTLDLSGYKTGGANILNEELKAKVLSA